MITSEYSRKENTGTQWDRTLIPDVLSLIPCDIKFESNDITHNANNVTERYEKSSFGYSLVFHTYSVL